MCTRVDPLDDHTYGAPKWNEIFENDITSQYLTDPATPSHCLAGSVSHCTREYMIPSEMGLSTGILPVIMPDGRAITCQPNGGSVYQIILLPFQAEAPVGFLVKPNTTYDEYVENVKNTRVWNNFFYLMKKHEQVFWHSASATHADPISSDTQTQHQQGNSSHFDGRHQVSKSER